MNRMKTLSNHGKVNFGARTLALLLPGSAPFCLWSVGVKCYLIVLAASGNAVARSMEIILGNFFINQEVK